MGLESCGVGSLFYSSEDIPLTEGAPLLHLDRESILQKVGGAVKKRFSELNDGNVIIIVRTSERQFSAFVARCTHWGAEVGLPEDGVFHCPFHGSQFSAYNGAVVNGPASQPLHQLKTIFDEPKQELKFEQMD
jgi:Rieske Fe-S protein